MDFPADVAGWLTEAEGEALRELAAGRTVLEVGAYAGRSTICLAQAAVAVLSIDPFDGRATPDPRDTLAEFRANLDRHGVRDRAFALVGRTQDVAPRLAGPFGLVFVDGDHLEAACSADLAHARRLLARGGAIAVHDYRRPGNEGVTAAVDASGLVVSRVVDTLAVCRVPPTLSVIVPTAGRPGLARALASVTGQLGHGDEVIVRRDATGDWGHTPRNLAMGQARGDYLLFLDDDDAYEPGAFAAIRRALIEAPGRPHLFRMRRGPPFDDVLWREPALACGNVSTQMVVAPNDPARLGRWGTRYEGDYDFIASTAAHYADGPVWREEVIACWRPGIPEACGTLQG